MSCTVGSASSCFGHNGLPFCQDYVTKQLTSFLSLFCNFRYPIFINQERLIRSDLLTSILVICMIHLHAAKLADLSFCSSDGVVEGTVPGYSCDQTVAGKALLILRHIPFLWKFIWRLKGPEQYLVFCAVAAVSWMIAALASLQSQRARQAYMSGVRITLLVSSKFASKVSSVVMLALWPDAPPSSYCKWYLPVEGSVLLWQALVAPVGASRQVYIAAADAACTFCCCWLLSERWPYTSVTPGMLLLSNLILAFISLLLAERMEAAEQQGGSEEGPAAAAGVPAARGHWEEPPLGAAEAAAGGQGVAGAGPPMSHRAGSGVDGLRRRRMGSSGQLALQAPQGGGEAGKDWSESLSYSANGACRTVPSGYGGAPGAAADGLGLHGKGLCNCGCGGVWVAATVAAATDGKDSGCGDCGDCDPFSSAAAAAAAAASDAPSSRRRPSLTVSQQQQQSLQSGGCLTPPPSPTAGPPNPQLRGRMNPLMHDMGGSGPHVGRETRSGPSHSPSSCMVTGAMPGRGHSSAACGNGDGGRGVSIEGGGVVCEAPSASTLGASTRSLSHALASFSTYSNSSGCGVGSGSTLALAESALGSMLASRPNSLVASEMSRRLTPPLYSRVLASAATAAACGGGSGGGGGVPDGADVNSNSTVPVLAFSPFSRPGFATRALSIDAASAAMSAVSRGGPSRAAEVSGAAGNTRSEAAVRGSVAGAQSAAEVASGSSGGAAGAAASCRDCCPTICTCRLSECAAVACGSSSAMVTCQCCRPAAARAGCVTGVHLRGQGPMARAMTTTMGWEEEEEKEEEGTPAGNACRGRGPALRRQHEEVGAGGSSRGPTRSASLAAVVPLRQLHRLIMSLLHGGRKSEVAGAPLSPPQQPTRLSPGRSALQIEPQPQTQSLPPATSPATHPHGAGPPSSLRRLQEPSQQPAPNPMAAAPLPPPPTALPPPTLPPAVLQEDILPLRDPGIGRRPGAAGHHAGSGDANSIVRGPGDWMMVGGGGGGGGVEPTVNVDMDGPGVDGRGDVSDGAADPPEPLSRPLGRSLPLSGNAALSSVTQLAAYSLGGPGGGPAPSLPIPCLSLSADQISSGTRSLHQLQTVWQGAVGNSSSNGAGGGGGKRGGTVAAVVADATLTMEGGGACGTAIHVAANDGSVLVEGAVAAGGAELGAMDWLRGAAPLVAAWTPAEAGGCRGLHHITGYRGPRPATLTAAAAVEEECSARGYGNFMLARALTATGGHNAVYDKPVLHHTRCSVKVGGVYPGNLPPGLAGRLARLLAEDCGAATASLAAVGMYVREGCVELVADILTPSAAAAAEAFMAALEAAVVPSRSLQPTADGALRRGFTSTSLSSASRGALVANAPSQADESSLATSSASSDEAAAEAMMTFLERTLLPQLTSALLPPTASEGGGEGDDASTAGRRIVGLQATVDGMNLALLTETTATAAGMRMGAGGVVVPPPPPLSSSTRLLPPPPSIVCVEPCCVALNQPSEDDTRDCRHQMLTLTVVLAGITGGDDAAAGMPNVFVRHGGRCLATVVRPATVPCSIPGTQALTVQISLVGIRPGVLFLEAAAAAATGAGSSGGGGAAAAGRDAVTDPERMLPLSLPWPVLVVGDVRVVAEVQELQQQLARAAPLRALSAVVGPPHTEANALYGGGAQQPPYGHLQYQMVRGLPPVEDQLGWALDGSSLALLLDMSTWFEAVSMPDAVVIAAAATTSTTAAADATTSSATAPGTAGFRMGMEGSMGQLSISAARDDPDDVDDGSDNSSWESSSASGEVDVDVDGNDGDSHGVGEVAATIFTTRHHHDVGSTLYSNNSNTHRRSRYSLPPRHQQRAATALHQSPLNALTVLPHTINPASASIDADADTSSTSCEAQLALLRTLQPPGELLPGSLDCAAEYEVHCRRAGALQFAAAGLGLRLLRFAVTRGWVATATLVLRGLMQHCRLTFQHIVALFPNAGTVTPAAGGGGGSDGREWPGAADSSAAACALPLLHTAVLSGRLLMVRAVQSWAQRYRCPLTWDEQAAGAGGLTPLHLAAVLEDGGRLAGAIWGLWPQAEALWAVARDGSGRTAQDYAVVRSISSSGWDAGGSSVQGAGSIGSGITAAVQQYEALHHHHHQQHNHNNTHHRLQQQQQFPSASDPQPPQPFIVGVSPPPAMPEVPQPASAGAMSLPSGLESPLAHIAVIRTPLDAAAAAAAPSTAQALSEPQSAAGASDRCRRLPSILPLTPVVDVTASVGCGSNGGHDGLTGGQPWEHQRLLQQVMQHLVAQRVVPSSVHYDEYMVAVQAGGVWMHRATEGTMGGAERAGMRVPGGMVPQLQRTGGYGVRFDRPSDCGSASIGPDSQWSHSTNLTGHTYSTLQQATTPPELRPVSSPTRNDADNFNLRLLSMADLPDLREDTTHPSATPTTTTATTTTAATTASAAPVEAVAAAASVPESGNPSPMRTHAPRTQPAIHRPLPSQSSSSVGALGSPGCVSEQHLHLGHPLPEDSAATGGFSGAHSSSSSGTGGRQTAASATVGSQNPHLLSVPWVSASSATWAVAASVSTLATSSHVGVPSRLALSQQQQSAATHPITSPAAAAAAAAATGTGAGAAPCGINGSSVREGPLVEGGSSTQTVAAAVTDCCGRAGSGLEPPDEEAEAAGPYGEAAFPRRQRLGTKEAACYGPASAVATSAATAVAARAAQGAPSSSTSASVAVCAGGILEIAERQGTGRAAGLPTAAPRIMVSRGGRLLAAANTHGPGGVAASDALGDSSPSHRAESDAYSSYGSQRSAMLTLGADGSSMGTGRGGGGGRHDVRRPFAAGMRRLAYADEYAPVCVPSVASRTAALDAAVLALSSEVMAAAVATTATSYSVTGAEATYVAAAAAAPEGFVRGGDAVAVSTGHEAMRNTDMRADRAVRVAVGTAPKGVVRMEATANRGGVRYPQEPQVTEKAVDRVTCAPARSTGNSKVQEARRSPLRPQSLSGCGMTTSRGRGPPPHHIRFQGPSYNDPTRPHQRSSGPPSPEEAAGFTPPELRQVVGFTCSGPVVAGLVAASESTCQGAPVEASAVAPPQAACAGATFAPLGYHSGGSRRRTNMIWPLLLPAIVLLAAVVVPMVVRGAVAAMAIERGQS